MSVLAINKKANFDYEISDKFEAGLVLRGYEVKSIKTKHISLKGAFVTVKQNKTGLPDIILTNAHIPKYKQATTIDNYDPERPRKLLLHKHEINKLIGKKKEQGLTFIPIKIYTTRGLIKLEFGIGRGKKKYDKRADIKKKDLDRKVRTFTKLNK